MSKKYIILEARRIEEKAVYLAEHFMIYNFWEAVSEFKKFMHCHGIEASKLQ